MSKVVFEKNGQHQPVKNSVGSGLPVEILGGGASDGAIVDGADSGIKATVKDYANSNPLVVVLSDTSGDPYVASGGTVTSGTATRTSVADSAIAVELLAANGSRKGAIITNDSSASLYVGLGTVDPTATNYTVIIHPGQTWTLPSNFTGQVKGIWASDPNDGAARVTELT